MGCGSAVTAVENRQGQRGWNLASLSALCLKPTTMSPRSLQLAPLTLLSLQLHLRHPQQAPSTSKLPPHPSAVPVQSHHPHCSPLPSVPHAASVRLTCWTGPWGSLTASMLPPHLVPARAQTPPRCSLGGRGTALSAGLMAPRPPRQPSGSRELCSGGYESAAVMPSTPRMQSMFCS